MASRKRKMGKLKILVVICTIIGIIEISLVVFNQPSSHSYNFNIKSESDEISKTTYDLRYLGSMDEVKIKMNWIDKPLVNVSCQILDRNFNIIEMKRTDLNGMCKFYQKDNNLSGDYYIKIMYNATFINGGIEEFKGFFIVTFGCCDQLNITDALKPAEWSNEPSIFIQ